MKPALVPSIICILGMHRSGTSLIARLLNLLGVYLGPQNRLVEPASANPKGFWEHRRFVNINNNILWKLGGHTHEPPVFSPEWQDQAELDDLRQRARSMIEEDFAGRDLWGWKDPRTCLTLPFWQRLLPPMRYVICVRHPTAVARSLIHRDRMSLVGSLNLWLVYMRSALTYTADQRRVIVLYDAVIDDWHSQLERLAEFIGRQDQAHDLAVQQATTEFIDADLRHHGSESPQPAGEFDTAAPAGLLELVEKAYKVLRQEREQFNQVEMENTLDAALDLVRLDRVHQPLSSRQTRC